MKGLKLLAWRHLSYHKARTLLLIGCLALTGFLPSATTALTSAYQVNLAARGESTPFLVGAQGSRFDLTLNALYFRRAELETLSWGELSALRNDNDFVVIPLHLAHTARGYAICGTTPEYFELHNLAPQQGTPPLILGDVLLGAKVAAALDLKVGDALFSDPSELYDISKPPALKMRVCGLLPATNTPDDDAVFVSINTAWVLDGLAHGHDDTETIKPKLVLGKTDNQVVVSQALLEYREVTSENLASFHSHLDPDARPLHGAIISPAKGVDAAEWAKATTLAKTRFEQSRVLQFVSPHTVLSDLMSFVFRLKTFFDAFSGVLFLITGLLTALVLTLSAKLRSREMATLHRIGCSRSATIKLHLYELTFVALASAGLAFLGVQIAIQLLPDLVQTL
ncbi:MAG: hypothetical protein HOM34_08255 [Planctomycetes bacterium]|jgi:putative ABC transport system permease protein|nr:hypothetical protein [Planctomycetota bacterium]MBT4029439.1 hypothetical protein [Planctomycetota bacterium]MBT4559982.1 hypothetical protein [Planctomycetota bacterium]MBT5120696.1 hypothetical protein [Planctomycetota bacterium]MBT7013294.1 hypothetical protein [Planctomycetota bacterium]